MEQYRVSKHSQQPQLASVEPAWAKMLVEPASAKASVEQYQVSIHP